MEDHSAVRRIVQAARDGRLISGISHRITDRMLRPRLGLPQVGGELPIAVTRSGNFTSHYSQLLEAAFNAAQTNQSRLSTSIRAIPRRDPH
jgi:hypothetical protein